MTPNSRATVTQRRDAGTLTWRGPALMLFARSGFAVVAQAIAALVLLLRSSPAPWHDAGRWFPVYGSLIDAGCLVALWRLTRREGIRLFDLVGFERGRLGRDVLLGLALVPVSLVFILGGVYGVGWLLYGAAKGPVLLEALPLPASLYGMLVFPFVWGLTEQMTYNGYLVTRFQVLGRRTALAVAIVSFVWALQHAFMPLTLDPQFMVFRALGPIPYALFCTLFYLRFRRLLPLAIAHALLDGATVLIPLVRG